MGGLRARWLRANRTVVIIGKNDNGGGDASGERHSQHIVRPVIEGNRAILAGRMFVYRDYGPRFNLLLRTHRHRGFCRYRLAWP